MMRCHCILMLFLAYPLEPTGYIVHSKYCGKREHQCGDVYVKTETKPFTERIFMTFSRGTSISVALASHTRESDI